ncbi:MAG TPA: hypothetical protein VGR61_09660 [Candidatus Dormibacteraeota bacterium]|nr:hypothetical protein [Candidatus Dormibacteraeota bacterium]
MSFLAFRGVMEAIGLVAGFRSHVVSGLGSALDVWNHWDVGWFSNLSQHGYRALSHVMDTPGMYHDGTAFPPAMPLLMRAGSVIGLSPNAAGIVWSCLFLALALGLLYHLAREDRGPDVARWSIVFLLVYPFALFLGVAYAEALVLLCAVGAYVAARRGLWWVAGVAVGVALLAKIVLVLLLLPLALECLGWDGRMNLVVDRRRISQLAALFAPALLALATWMLYLQVEFHEPLRFLTAQKGWGRAVGLPTEQVLYIFRHGGNAGIRFINAVDLVAVAILGAMAVYTYRRVRPTYGVLLGLFFVLFALNTSLESNGRHLVVLFPLFVGLAVWTEKRNFLRALLVVVQLPLAVALVARFATGHWAG